MIYYNQGGIWYLLKLFQLKGSVFPSSFFTAAPCAIIAAVVRFLINDGHLGIFQSSDSILNQTTAWTGFSFFVGFFIVFRTSQAYSRFWDGCTSSHRMRAEWFDACAALIAFCAHSKAEQGKIQHFKHTLVRLFSMLHAAALADLEDLNSTTPRRVGDAPLAFTYELVDPSGIDEASIEELRKSESRVELLFSWIQLLIVENSTNGVLSIPPPILSRAFQELANGMVAFHDSVKISYIPFPFPYAQNCDFLLCLHWLLSPFVFTQWVREPVWAFLFVFVQVFVMWSLNFIAVEIENPFGTDKNDLDGPHMQSELNRHLLMLLTPVANKAPTLSANAVFTEDANANIAGSIHAKAGCFLDIWPAIKDEPLPRKDGPEERQRRASIASDEARDREEAWGKAMDTDTTGVKVDMSRATPTKGPDQAAEVVPLQLNSMHGSWEVLPDGQKVAWQQPSPPGMVPSSGSSAAPDQDDRKPSRQDAWSPGGSAKAKGGNGLHDPGASPATRESGPGEGSPGKPRTDTPMASRG